MHVGLVMEMDWIKKEASCRVKAVPCGMLSRLAHLQSGSRPLHMSDICVISIGQHS